MNRYSLINLAFFLLSAQLTFGQSMWSNNTNRTDDFSSISYVENFAPYDLELSVMENKLANAPMEFSGQAGTLFPIPLPSGEIVNLRIFESPVMQPELAAKFPHFKTYSGYDEQDNRTNVRIDYTSRGFRVYGQTSAGVFYVVPLVSNKENTKYLSFLKTAIISSNDAHFKCNLVENELAELNPAEMAVMNRGSVGEELRTLRVAIAARGEYTFQHGGTVEGGLAAIVTAINRLNQIFENEISVRFLLVNDNDQIIYTNSQTDPYSNLDYSQNQVLSIPINENVDNLNTVIGFDNYDIGHLFGTEGGGLAGVGVVCSALKGWASSGVDPAEGEEFVEQYVAHELGHQLGGTHSWNSCVDAQELRSGLTAYEPGSGSTIMSYAGLCQSDNVTTNSDPYFNHASHLQFIQNINFLPSTCTVNISTGNNAPEVTAPIGGKVIPVQTPFMLTAEGTDADGDELTYCWEQYNLGPITPLGFPVGNAPSFRSFSPTDDPMRMFPRRFDLILNQPPSTNEVLPTTSRDLDFVVTVRDNHPGSGGIGWDYISLESSDNAGPFLVLEPNGDDGIEWESNTWQEVKWDVANTTSAPVSCATVDILLSYSNGLKFDFVLKENVPNSGTASVLVPDSTSTKARIMVKAHDNYFFDISDQKVIVNQGPLVSTSEIIAQQIELFPNPTDNMLNINFNTLDGNATMQLLDLQGRILMNDKVVELNSGNTQLDLTNIANGVYLLKMNIENKVVTKKVVVQR